MNYQLSSRMKTKNKYPRGSKKKLQDNTKFLHSKKEHTKVDVLWLKEEDVPPVAQEIKEDR